jgi:SAM-dependent methyltransferase
MTEAELRREYPELANEALVPVDVVDDGERLLTIPNESLDFLIANHFLEHCQDPIGTLEVHLSKLLPGGALFYAVPDKRFTFDVDRPVTPLAHVVRDHEEGPAWSRLDHYEEWSRFVYADPDEPVRDEATVVNLARGLNADDYSIHFHVWTQAELLELILYWRERSRHAFDIEVAWRRSIELIVVLRKDGAESLTSSPASFAAETSAELTRQVDDLRAQAGERNREVEALRARVESAERVATDLQNSLSWRITSPLRTLKRVVRHRF